MSLTQDLEKILKTVLPSDPSFRRIDHALMDSRIAEARRCAIEGSKDAFLLSAMRLLALPNNGHTRLIPNDAIAVLPLRFVSVGTGVQLTATAGGITAPTGELLAVNGTPLARIEAAAEEFLAGTRQRKRAIGAIVFAWPYALAQLGFSSKDTTTDYRVRAGDGQVTDLKLENGDTIPASVLYPRNEHGKADAAWKPEGFVEIGELEDHGLTICLSSFFDPHRSELPKAISGAAEYVRSCVNGKLLIDVRGNTGGDFLLTMPLIDAISECANGPVVVLVDKFTFSAAIVFVAILKYRLGRRLRIIGEEMGDGSMFFAEGGLLDLPFSGAVVRYSSGFHDWENGTSDETTPADIAQQMVPAGKLTLDREWTAPPTADFTRGALCRNLLGILED